LGRYVFRITRNNFMALTLIFQSTLLSKMTHTKSEAAAYEFTTLTVRSSNLTLVYVSNACQDRLSQEYWSTRGLEYNFWISLELSRVLVKAEEEVVKSYQVCIGATVPIPTNGLCVAAKTADLIIMMLDATKSEEQRSQLEYELDAVGIRLNKSKPDVVFKRKTTGGVNATGFRCRHTLQAHFPFRSPLMLRLN
jgi:uncharacterized protein